VRRLLEEEDREDLLQQLDHLDIVSRHGCGQFDCASFTAQGGISSFSVREQLSRGKYIHEALDLPSDKGIILRDMDNLGRIVFFEIFNRDDVR
jgi:hypothetical protein